MNGWDYTFTASQEPWQCRAVSEGKIPANYVLEAGTAYVYVLQTSGLLPSATTVGECVVYFVLSFIFLIISNVFVGVVAAAQSEADPQTKEFKSRMDRLNHFLRDMHVPVDLKMATREHFRFTRDLVRKQSYNDLYPLLSPKLRGQVLAHLSSRTLKSVPYFCECEEGLLNALSQRLRHFGYSQGEMINHHDDGSTLSIVTRGTAVRGGKPITLYQFWGEDMIVTSRTLRDRRPASALTYVEIVCLTRDELFEELTHFPKSKKHIHLAAVNIAMMRAPILIVDYLVATGRNPSSLFDAMKRLGSGTTAEDRELQAVLKAVNDAKPLRGFARELMEGGDEVLKKRSTAAVEALEFGGGAPSAYHDPDRACRASLSLSLSLSLSFTLPLPLSLSLSLSLTLSPLF